MKSASHVRIQNGPGSLLKAASEGLDNGVWLSMGGWGRFRRRTAYPNGWHPSRLLHAASKAMRQVFHEGFALFVAAYRTAADKLKRGAPNPGSPLGCFPPALPFVGR